MTDNGLSKKYTDLPECEQYAIRDIHSIDEYDITIIDLSFDEFWKNGGNGYNSISQINNFRSACSVLKNGTAKVFIILPQNIGFKYHRYGNTYKNVIDLKDMMASFISILSELYGWFDTCRMSYENTSTVVGDYVYSAAFYFSMIPEDRVILKSKGNKAVMVQKDNVIITTLKVDGGEELLNIFRQVGIDEKNFDAPLWLDDYPMFDDTKQKEIVLADSNKIPMLQGEIDNANSILDENKRIKSVLYTSGEELVGVVFDILEEIMGCDLTGFVDEKKEDFLFDAGEFTFIGEIKGVNHNVKSGNVSQLDNHYQSYLDEHGNNHSGVVALLIINHQRDKAIDLREPVKETQIKLAERNGSLIIETITLLKLLEKYRNGELTRDEIINKLAESKGLLRV